MNLLRLKVRANPQGNLALVIRPDRPRHKGVSLSPYGEGTLAVGFQVLGLGTTTENAVMPLDVPGCTRATLTETTSGAPCPK